MADLVTSHSRVALATAVAFALLIALTGCSPGDVDDEAQGGTLIVYVSAPLRGEGGAEGRAIVDGAKLALADANGTAGGVDVEAVYMDNTSGEGSTAGWDPVVVADNARRAAQDAAAIAYIGELVSGATRISLPITNEAAMLQVSAGATAVDLTREAPGSNDIPELYQPTGERTFGRVIPDDEVQASAAAGWAKELGAGSVRVIEDGSEFGAIVGTAFAEAADALGLAVREETLTGVANGGTAEDDDAADGSEAAIDLDYLAGSSPRLLASAANADVIATDAFLLGSPRLWGAADDGLLLTSSAQDPRQLPPPGRRFAADFEREFDREPNRYAAYGYEAMALVLDSIERATEAEDRSAVIDAFFATSDRQSVLGTYSIDQVGDTTLDAISGYRIESGEPRFDAPLESP